MSQTLFKFLTEANIEFLKQLVSEKSIVADWAAVYSGQIPNVALWVSEGSIWAYPEKRNHVWARSKKPADLAKGLRIPTPTLLFFDQVIHEEASASTVWVTKGSKVRILDKPTVNMIKKRDGNLSFE